MKNISRRVFIKGMAVAAVATAASTVLTGCKLPVAGEETETVVAPANSFTYTDGEKSLTVAAPKLDIVTYNAGEGKEILTANVNVNNGLGKAVKFQTADKAANSTNNKEDYVVVVEGKITDKDGLPVTFAVDTKNSTLLKAAIDSVDAVAAKDYMLATQAVSDKWVKAVVTYTVYKKVKGLDEKSHSYNKIEKHEFTYNN